MVTNTYTACVVCPSWFERPQPRNAWYARYICELPSIRNSVGRAMCQEVSQISLSFMPLGTRRARGIALLLFFVHALAAAACGGGFIKKEYEYEEELYLDLDGSATVYLN